MDGGFHRVVDPFRSPRDAVRAALAPAGSLADKLRVARLRRRLLRSSARALLQGDDVPTAEALRAEGFSAQMADRFFRPLVGGIQLDPPLGTSQRLFDLVFRSLARGDAAVPTLGMGEISRQLADGLAPDVLRCDAPVTAVAPGRVTLADGEVRAAADVVVATDGPTASRLLGLPEVRSGRPRACGWRPAPRPCRTRSCSSTAPVPARRPTSRS